MISVNLTVPLTVVQSGVTIEDDDLTGVDQLLCTPEYVTACTADGEFESGPPENWGIREFIEVDLANAMLSTTEGEIATSFGACLEGTSYIARF